MNGKSLKDYTPKLLVPVASPQENCLTRVRLFVQVIGQTPLLNPTKCGFPEIVDYKDI